MNFFYNWILKSSAEKITKVFILLPIVILSVLIILEAIFKSNIVYGMFVVILAILFFICTWIWTMVNYSKKENTGMDLKWFNYSFYLLSLFVIWQIYLVVIDAYNLREIYENSYFFSSVDFVFNLIAPFGLLGYVIICYYAAKVLYTTKTNKKATFIKVIPYNLLLVFMPLSIPFLHLYIYENRKDSSKLIKLFGIAFFLIFTLFVVVLVLVIKPY